MPSNISKTTFKYIQLQKNLSSKLYINVFQCTEHIFSKPVKDISTSTKIFFKPNYKYPHFEEAPFSKALRIILTSKRASLSLSALRTPVFSFVCVRKTPCFVVLSIVILILIILILILIIDQGDINNKNVDINNNNK